MYSAMTTVMLEKMVESAFKADDDNDGKLSLEEWKKASFQLDAVFTLTRHSTLTPTRPSRSS